MRFFERSAERSHPLVEPETFSQFYENTHLNVYRYVMALCGGDERQAEDVTTDAYLRAWRNRKAYSGSAETALGWILTIARRSLIDEFRKKSARPFEDDLGDDMVDPTGDIERNILSEEITDQVIQALQQISVNQREIIVLRYVLGWRVSEIATHLAIEENTVSVAIHRTLKRLRDILVSQGV
ncbi:MAG TPA: sigma-70 family RNA polymerase sigma factor [Anaerolineaceae bacterium]|nr:sigma-70 family RNA polymerase sigma factor [Anaerolineaceae bacterium]